MLVCNFCGKEGKNAGGLAAHIKCCHSNPNRVKHPRSPNAGAKKGCVSWNAGLRGDPRCKHSDEAKQNMLGKSTGKAKTPEAEAERIRKISETAKLTNGGYRQGSGRGKKGTYKGFFCDSSYELAYVIYCLDHGIDIQRNLAARTYEWEGSVKKYIPDFIVNGEFVEIKGYSSPQWEAKLKANPDVKVLYEKDLQDVFNYVHDKYGKDFIRLYEGK